MLHEYAVAPEVVATWVDRDEGRYFIGKFGIGSPRIISRYPRKRWEKQVWKAWQACDRDSQLDRKRMEELIARLSHAMVQRLHAAWHPGRSWAENAVEEHHRVPFHAILAQRNPKPEPAILVADDLDETTRRWNHPRSTTVRRTAEDIADAVGGMLRAATDIVFVDPYFAPHRGKFLKVLRACLGACFKNRAVASPNIRVFSSDREQNGTFEFFEMECRKRLPRILPAGQNLTIRRLQERPGGERLHNRYILTELGGVSFGAGLDEGKAGSMDDLALLERDPYRLRWGQYASDQPAFDRPEGEITVVGTGKTPRRAQANSRR